MARMLHELPARGHQSSPCPGLIIFVPGPELSELDHGLVLPVPWPFVPVPWLVMLGLWLVCEVPEVHRAPSVVMRLFL